MRGDDASSCYCLEEGMKVLKPPVGPVTVLVSGCIFVSLSSLKGKH